MFGIARVVKCMLYLIRLLTRNEIGESSSISVFYRFPRSHSFVETIALPNLHELGRAALDAVQTICIFRRLQVELSSCSYKRDLPFLVSLPPRKGGVLAATERRGAATCFVAA